jgi:glycosyltransferase involved in cell wall biosynthesis
MKILIISHFLPYPPKGGSPLRNYNLLKETAAEHELHMFAFYQKVHLKDGGSLEKRVEEIGKFCDHLEVFPIPTDRSAMSFRMLLLGNLFSRQPYSAWRFYSRDIELAVKRHLDKHEDFDLLQLDTIALANFVRVAPELPTVLVHQNVESQLLYRRSEYLGNPLAKRYMAYQAWKLKQFESWADRRVDCHTTVSEEDKQTLAAHAPNAEIMVVPNGVDPDYFRPTDDSQDSNNLIYVGGMTWFPNLDAIRFFLDDIWPAVKQQVPEARLTHIGRQTTNEFQSRADTDRSLNFLGFVDDIRPDMTRAGVYIVPLRIGGGTRLKILDAMSMGKAIVSTSIGCEGIEVTDGHDIVIADTAADFAARTVELMKDPARREQIGRHARQTVEQKYAWPVIAPRLNDAYKLAVEARRQRPTTTIVK